MNILRHKSWHVRTRSNINRVRRDEEKARNEELRLQKRIDLAESEARIGLLRQRRPPTDEDDTNEDTIARRHLNIFADFSDKNESKNKDHEKEAKEEKDKYETKTGILKYLVEKDLDSDQNWYLDSHEKRMKLKDNSTDEKDSEKLLKDNKTKQMNDPMEDIKRYLDSMKSKSEDKTTKRKISDKSIEFIKSSESSAKTKTKHKKKHKKHKKHKKRKHLSESSDESEDNASDQKVSKTLQQLRAERLERERIERERTVELLTGRKNIKEDSVIMDERRRTYNSQFNPEIARQNIDK